MAAAKTYRIIHNPYSRRTKIIALYPDCATEKDMKEDLSVSVQFRDLVGEGIAQPIQNVGYAIIERIDEKEKKSDRIFAIEFGGIPADQKDFQRIYELYDEEHPGRLANLKMLDDCVPLPEDLNRKLEKVCADIAGLYHDDTKVLELLEKCRIASKHELNVLFSGLQNSGKSTLINALLGFELLPTSTGIETACLYEIRAGSENQIIAETLGGYTANISFPYSYQITGEAWLRKLMDDQSYKAVMEKAVAERDIYAQMRYVIQAINDDARRKQEENQRKKEESKSEEKDFASKITVILKDWKIFGASSGYHFWDLPGEAASQLREEHKKLIQQLCSNVESSILVYVCSADAFLHEATRQALRDMEQHHQIDFLHSIYVLNKAESIPDLDELRKNIENDFTFRYRKVIMAGGLAGFYAHGKTKNKILNNYRDIDEEPGYSLPEKAHLPQGYDLQELESHYMNYLGTMPEEYGTVLRRSGVPLLVSLMEEYNERGFKFKRLDDCRQQIDNMMAEIDKEEKRRLEEQEKTVAEKETEAKKCREELQKKYEEADKNTRLEKEQCQGQIRAAQADYCEECKKELCGPIEEKSFFSELGKNPFVKFNKDKVKERIEPLVEQFNRKKEDRKQRIEANIQEKIEGYCRGQQKTLWKSINADNEKLTGRDLAGIKEIIGNSQVTWEEGQEVKIPDIKNGNGILGIFQVVAWREKAVKTKVKNALNQNVEVFFNEVSGIYADSVKKAIDGFFNKLKEDVEMEIQNLNPELKELTEKCEKAQQDHEKMLARKEDLEQIQKDYQVILQHMGKE